MGGTKHQAAQARILVQLLLLSQAVGTTYFLETFEDDDRSSDKGSFKVRWVESEVHPHDQRGTWNVVSSGTPKRFDVEVDSMASYKFPGEDIPEVDLDHGLKTTSNFSYYGITAKLDKPFFSHEKTLYIQFSVRLEQFDGMDCGGAYIKLFPSGIEQEKMDGKTPYIFMFGPDICGAGKQFTQFIVGYDKLKHRRQATRPQTYHHLRKRLHCETDKMTHLYTLIIRPDNTYEYRVDNSRVDGGYLEEDFGILPPEKITDPLAKKPDGWAEDSMLPDPNHQMPAGYGKEPKYVPDPSKSKPAIWNDMEDGEWEPPLVLNPLWQGDWEPKMIKNPDYQGPWSPPLIDNPDYDADEAAFLYDQCNPCDYIGFDLWQVDSGTVFDDILVTDSETEAEAFASITLEKIAWDRVSLNPETETQGSEDDENM